MTATARVTLQEQYFAVMASLSDAPEIHPERQRQLEAERDTLEAAMRALDGLGPAQPPPTAFVLSREFLTAGRAVFTVTSGRSGEHATFKVRKSKDDGRAAGPAYFVSVKTGADFSYIGILDPARLAFMATRASKLPVTDPRVRAFEWVLRVLVGTAPLGASRIEHAGRCGRCGRELTHPRSLQTGFGPECEGRL